MPRSLKVKSQYISQVKQAVKRNGYATQQMLAEELGLARSTVSNFVNGKPVDNLNFYEICALLALNYQEIADWEESEAQSPDPDGERRNGMENPEADFSRYIERPPIEQSCYDTVRQPGSLLRIKSAKGMGKTLLVDKILSYATQNRYKVVDLSFLQANQSILSDLDRLLQWFALVVSRQLGLLSQFDEHWSKGVGLGVYGCTSYFEDYLLPSLSNPLTIALEDVDRLFSHRDIADDFLSLFRSWHEEAKRNSSWQKLRLIIAYSTEEYIPSNLNHSPLNAGTVVELPDFTTEQVFELACRYSANLTRDEVQNITDIVGGHPYLVQKAIYAITHQQVSVADFQSTAATEQGIYRDHLRGHLLNLQQHPHLAAGIRNVVESSSPVDLGSTINWQLHSLGLVEFERNAIKPRYRLYAEYFRDRLTN